LGKISNVNKERQLLGSFFISRKAIDIAINNNFMALELVDDFNQLVAENILQICRANSGNLPSIDVVLDNLNFTEKERDQNRIKLNRYKKMMQREILNDQQAIDITVNNLSIIRDLSIKRKVINAIKNGLEHIDIPARDFVSNIAKDLSNVEMNDGVVTEVHIYSGFKEIKAEMQYQMENGEEFGFKTFYRDIDAIMEASGYFAKGSLTYIVGRPSNYKTGLALNVATNMAKNGIVTAIFSHEMSPKNCYRRILARVAGIDMAKIKKPSTLTPEEWAKLDAAIKQVETWPLYIIDGSSLSIGQIDSVLSYLKSKYGLQVAWWDYFQLIRKRDGSIPTEERDFSEVSEELRMFPKKYDLAAIALSQANRGCEQRDDKRPTLKDIRSTGKSEMDAENVLYVYRDEFYYMSKSECPNHLEVGAIKVREGELRRALLHFNGAKATLGNCDPMIVMDKSIDYVGGGGSAN
jgi:replicative DNA helicase